MRRVRAGGWAVAVMVAFASPALGQSGDGGGPAPGGSNDGGGDFPAPFDTLVGGLNPARLQRRRDAARGRDVERSDRPRAPEIPLAVFFESIRPLGALKYENQLNYFVAGFTGDAPTLQTFAYEYVFADWNAARLEVIAPDRAVEALGFGYQRTFGVGPRGNWVHGALIQPEAATTGSGFVGGTAIYTFAWKPERESPWTATLSAGANRAAFENRPLGGAAGGVGSMMIARPELGRREETSAEAERQARVWRPYASLNVFRQASKTVTLGTEVDAFPHPRFGEYLVLPNLTWRPTKHFFVQVGAGYYEIGGRGQATLVCRVNLLQPSPRRPRDEPREE